MSLIHAAIYLALSAQVSNLNPPVVMEYKSDVSTSGVNAISNLDVNNFSILLWSLPKQNNRIFANNEHLVLTAQPC